MFYGLLNLPWWGYIVVTLLMTHITIVCITVFLHRHQAHRALDLHPIASHFFRAWLWLTTGMETKAWASIHRKHHAKCETAEDPHSPQVVGIETVLWQGSELYRREAKNQETLTRYGQGTPDDWLERHIYTPYSAKGIFIMLAIDIVLFGVPGLTVWAVQMSWAPFFAAGVINGIGHYWGYRNFECADASTNILPFGILIGGEELHNNHHSYPSSAKLSVKWWEFDIGWFYIRLLSFLKLAKVKRVVPTPEILPGRKEIDAAGLQAIIYNRIQVLTQYSKEVILPLFRQERKKANLVERGSWERIKEVLLREDSLIDEIGRRNLQQFLEKNKAIEVVYNFRAQLQAIWNRTTANQKELLDALHEWCQRAEETRIQKLQAFADYLRGYTLKVQGL